MLIGVSGSWKTIPAAEMVTTSLKIPAIDKVTTEVRWRSANSEDVMQNARTPGNKRMRGPSTGPFFATRMPRPCQSDGMPSTGMAMIRRETNMIGAR